MLRATTINRKLYGDAIEILFKSHPYHSFKRLDMPGTVPSVTSITGKLDKSRQLIIWAIRTDFGYLRSKIEERTGEKFTVEELYPIIDEAARQHDVKKLEAASIGDKAHEFAELFSLAKIKGGDTPELPNAEQFPEVHTAITAFLEWYNDNHIEFLEVENIVYSKKHHYAGFFDCIAVVNGKRVLVDYKTSNGFYNEHSYQKSGYWGAWEEQTGETLDGALVVRFSKEAKGGPLFETKLYTPADHKKDFKAFLGLHAVAKREKELQEIWRKENT